MHPGLLLSCLVLAPVSSRPFVHPIPSYHFHPSFLFSLFLVHAHRFTRTPSVLQRQFYRRYFTSITYIFIHSTNLLEPSNALSSFVDVYVNSSITTASKNRNLLLYRYVRLTSNGHWLNAIIEFREIS